MAGEPIGLGEEKNPKGGNSILTTRNLNGGEVKTLLWISQFATTLDLQIDSAQVRRGLVHRPIRFSEKSLAFTTLWNVKDRDKYLALGKKIREHWAYNLNESRPTPMVFKYFGASKAWKGTIENWETAFSLTDVVLAYTFNMRVITTPDHNKPAQASSTIESDTPYAPSVGQAADYGAGWETGKDFNLISLRGRLTKASENLDVKTGKTSGGKRGGQSNKKTPNSSAGSDTNNGLDSGDVSNWTTEDIVSRVYYYSKDSNTDAFNPK